MFKTLLLIAALALGAAAQSGGIVRIAVKDHDTKAPIEGANVSVKGTTLSAVSDAAGVAVIAGVPDGEQTLVVSSLGYSDAELKFVFPLVGVFGEKTFGKFSVFANAENITDVKQGRYAPVVFPPFTDPAFAQIYAPLEGRVFNAGVKIRF